MRIIGLDIHRAFAEAVAWEDGKLRRLGRVDMRRDLLEAFAKKLSPDDVVVIEATGNASSAAVVVAPHVKKVVIANPKQVRIIAQGCARPEGSRARLQHQEPPGRRTSLGRAGGGRLRSLRRRLEPARSPQGAHGCRK